MRNARRGRREDGFALGLVVLLLFAIGVAAATGYQVVMTEFQLATQARDGHRALTVAGAGLERYLGERLGGVGDSVSYAIGGGIATVTARKLVEADSSNHLYYLRSEGTVIDPRGMQSPARRVVGTYAWHRRAPVPHVGALLMTGGLLRVEGPAGVNGFNMSPLGSCYVGGAPGTAGVGTAGSVITVSGGIVTGNPGSQSYFDYQAVYDAVGVRWDVLTSPYFPVEFDGSPPNFALLPVDSFPLVRYQGDLVATASWSGRGALVVTGRFRPSVGFHWDGIILAGELTNVYSGDAPLIHGTLVAGLNGTNPSVTIESGSVRYHSCHVYRASRALSYMEVVQNTLVEVN
jgi:hypothetical protein